MSLAGCYFLLYKIFDPKYSVVKRHECIRIWHKGNTPPPPGETTPSAFITVRLFRIIPVIPLVATTVKGWISVS